MVLKTNQETTKIQVKKNVGKYCRILKVCRVMGKVFLKHKPPVSQPAKVFSMQPLKTATFNSLQNEVIDIQLTRSVQQEMDPALRHLNT